jgi:hypothetical protein
MIVILEDKQNDIKQAFFYDRVPVGGKLRAFGSAPSSMRIRLTSLALRVRNGSQTW